MPAPGPHPFRSQARQDLPRNRDQSDCFFSRPVSRREGRIPTLSVDHRHEEAEHAGFRACQVCFAAEQMLPIEGYGPIRRQALEDARLRELAYPPVPDQAVQDRLEKAGLKVLGSIPGGHQRV